MVFRLSPAFLVLLLSLPLVNCASVSPEHSEMATLRSTRTEPAAPPPLPNTGPPTVLGQSAIVVDAMSGRILAAKNADQPRAVASTQKLMTALLVMEAGQLDKPITIQAVDTRVEPTKLYLKPGETYTRRQLLRVILVKSANDAAMVLARDVGGSVAGFSALMNQRARSLGMMQSNFKNPHGLTVPGQYSTARDLSILARAIYRYSFVRECMRTRSFTFVYNDGRTKVLKNTNKLLDRLSYTTGMKTGTTNASGKCLVSSAEHNGRVVIAVVLKSNNPTVWSDSEKLLRWALEAPKTSPVRIH